METETTRDIIHPSLEEGLDYMVNVSYSGKPFYVWPAKAKPQTITMLKNYCRHCGVYFLFQKGVVVYIGASRDNVYNRIYNHFEDKEFDAYFIMNACDDNGIANEEVLDKILSMEAFLIKTFKPKYNSLLPIALQKIRKPKLS